MAHVAGRAAGEHRAAGAGNLSSRVSALWLAQSYATQIALSRLRSGDSRTVVQAVLQNASVPETVVQEIVTQAAGIPSFWKN